RAAPTRASRRRSCSRWVRSRSTSRRSSRSSGFLRPTRPTAACSPCSPTSTRPPEGRYGARPRTGPEVRPRCGLRGERRLDLSDELTETSRESVGVDEVHEVPRAHPLLELRLTQPREPLLFAVRERASED